MSEETKIREFIFENFMIGEGAEDLDSDNSFLEKGIIDSTGILELVMFVEETYGIEVEDDEVIPENFDSINKLGAYVRRKTISSQPFPAFARTGSSQFAESRKPIADN